MSQAVELLELCQHRGVRMELTAELKLRYHAPRGLLTDDLKEQLRECSGEMKQLLAAREYERLRRRLFDVTDQALLRERDGDLAARDALLAEQARLIDGPYAVASDRLAELLGDRWESFEMPAEVAS